MRLTIPGEGKKTDIRGTSPRRNRSHITPTSMKRESVGGDYQPTMFTYYRQNSPKPASPFNGGAGFFIPMLLWSRNHGKSLGQSLEPGGSEIFLAHRAWDYKKSFYPRARRRKETLATVGTQEFIINFIFNNSDIFGGISLNPIILRLIINPWKNCLYTVLNWT